MNDQQQQEDDDQQQEGVRLSPEDLRNLRQAAKERDELQKKLQTQERDMAFLQANLDLNDPKVKYFVKGYEGELTVEAIRAQAEADGFLQQQQQQSQDADLAAQQRIMKASAGANETGQTDLSELINQANSPEEVMKVMIAAGRPTSWNRPSDR